MEPEPVDPALPRRIDSWPSPTLGRPLSIATYGERGRPLLLFPLDGADFLENERLLLVKELEGAILAGRVRLFSVDSVDRWAWKDGSVPVAEQARRQSLFAQTVEQEVVPFVRSACADPHLRIATAGVGFGAFHAANALFRRPDLFDAVVAMSGFFDLAPAYLRGFHDENCYYNNPVWYLSGLGGDLLEDLRTCAIVLVAGQGAGEDPEASRRLSAILASKDVPHTLDLWGFDVSHDASWWRKMLPHWVDRMGW